MRRCRRSPSGSAASSAARAGLGRRLVDALEQVQELLQRVVALAAPVVDQVEGDLALLVGDCAMGRILAGVTMAESSPACDASCRNTELSTWRAAGVRPKETLETPRVVWTSG